MQLPAPSISRAVAASAVLASALAGCGAHLPGTSAGPEGTVNVVNDTAAETTVTFCPEQDCARATTRVLQRGGRVAFAASHGTLPDSILTKLTGKPRRCTLDISTHSAPDRYAPVVMFVSTGWN